MESRKSEEHERTARIARVVSERCCEACKEKLGRFARAAELAATVERAKEELGTEELARALNYELPRAEGEKPAAPLRAPREERPDGATFEQQAERFPPKR